MELTDMTVSDVPGRRAPGETYCCEKRLVGNKASRTERHDGSLLSVLAVASQGQLSICAHEIIFICIKKSPADWDSLQLCSNES